MNALFDKKRWINILGKFPSDNNARNITHYYEFSDAVLRHAIRKLTGMNEKTQSYIFTLVPGSQRTLQITVKNCMMTSSNENISALLTRCAMNSPIPCEFPSQRPVTRNFDIFFDLRPNKRLSKYSKGWWFEAPSRPLWRYCNVISILHLSQTIT